MMKKRTPLKLLYMAIAMFATALLGLPAGLAADAKKTAKQTGRIRSSKAGGRLPGRANLQPFRQRQGREIVQSGNEDLP